MSSKFKIRIIFAALAILVLSVLVFTVIYLNNKKNADIFDNLLKEIDISDNNQESTRLEKLYSSAFRYAKKPNQYKSLLKRVFLKSDFDNLMRISEKAYNSYPGDSQILSIYLYALLKTGNILDALEILSTLKNKLTEENFIIEINILAGNINSDDNIFYKVFHTQDSALYKELYQKTGNINFLIDSGLLYLENGDYKSADSVFSNLNLKKNELNKLLFYVSYYAEQYQKASNLLSTYDLGFKVEDLKLIQIDIFIKQKLYVKAYEEISEFIKLFPYYSSVPYINLIIINLKNNAKNINFEFEDVISHFPDNRSLLLAVVDYSINNNNENSALIYIDNYLKRNTSDLEIEIILKQLKGISKPENMVNLLYELVNKYPENETGSRFLAMNLYENRNMGKLEKYLNRFDSDTTKGWVMFYKALLDSYNGNFKEAVDEYESSYKIDKQWQTLYNLSIVSQYNKNYNSAIEYLQQAENSLMNTELNLKVKSTIRTKLALLYFEMKDYNKSSRELQNALDLDKDNMQANLLFKKLESAAY